MFSSPYSPFFTSGLMSNKKAPTTSASVASSSNSQPRKAPVSQSSSTTSSEADMQAATDLLSFLSFEAQETREEQTERERRALPSKRPVPGQTLPSVPRKRRNTTSRTISSVAFQVPSLPPKVRTLTRSDTMATRSTASTGYRRAKRSDTLAILEGREQQGNGAKRIPRRNAPAPPRRSANFMNFTDNEDSDSESSSNDESIDDDDDRDSFVKLLPTYSLNDDNLKHAAPFSPVDEDESVIPKFPDTPRKSFKRRSTISDWLPMQSFMDMKSDNKDEDSQWGWRSFIEIAAAS